MLLEELRHKLIAARERRGLKRPAVARELGITASNYRYFENGRSVIGLEYLLRLPRILKCRITDLLPDSIVTADDRARAGDHGFRELESDWAKLEEGEKDVIRNAIKAFARDR